MRFRLELPWRFKWVLAKLPHPSYWSGLFSIAGARALPAVFRSLFRRTNTSAADNEVTVPVGTGSVGSASFSEPDIFSEVFVDHCYDLDIEPPALIVDIGGNVGMFALRMKQLYPDATIHCFEPLPANAGRLARNAPFATLHRLGVSDRRAEVPIYVHPSNTGGHSIIASEADPRAEAQTISVVPMADVFALTGGGRIDLLKLDCEGAEKEIVLSLDAADAARIGTIVYEPTPSYYDPALLRGHLEGLGYRCTWDKGLIIARGPD
jgi:FkbM family methyltransferase